MNRLATILPSELFTNFSYYLRLECLVLLRLYDLRCVLRRVCGRLALLPPTTFSFISSWYTISCEGLFVVREVTVILLAGFAVLPLNLPVMLCLRLIKESFNVLGSFPMPCVTLSQNGPPAL